MNQEQSVDFAKKYLEDLLAFFEVNVTVEATVTENIIELNVPDTEHNSILIGRGAETLRSMQYLISTTLRNHIQRDLANKGKDRVANYSWSKTAQQTLELYEKALSKKS